MIITHTDLDGFVSALVAMEITGQPAKKVYPFNYEQDRDDQWMRLATVVTPNEEVWFVDISFRLGELEWARMPLAQNGIHTERPQNWVWVDHHESSLEFNPIGIFDRVQLETDGSKCAADLCLDEWLCRTRYGGEAADSERFEFMTQWVDAAHDRDLWINETRVTGTKLTMVVSALLKQGWEGFRNGLECAQRMSPKAFLVHFKDLWNSQWREYEVSCAIAKRTAYNYVQQNSDTPITLVLACVAGYASDVADTLYEDGTEIIGMIQHFKKDSVLSLRTKREDVNCATLAKAFGGGGHPQAAGGKLMLSHLREGYSSIANDVWYALEKAR